MSKRSIRTLTTLAVAAGAAFIAQAAPAAAGSIGPRQYFEGLVNTRTVSAVVDVLCPGPVNFGHPLPNQTVGVELAVPPITLNEGYTGLDATGIDVWLTWPTPITPPPPVHIAKFSGYGSAPIPTTVTVPCSGSGVMTFTPTPNVGGRAATVDVTFVNLGG